VRGNLVVGELTCHQRKPYEWKVVVDLKASNAPIEDIQKLVFDNAKEAFDLPV